MSDLNDFNKEMIWRLLTKGDLRAMGISKADIKRRLKKLREEENKS